MHIAKINYAEFYRAAFDTVDEAARFVKEVESTSTEQTKAKIVLHQAARMIWLADRVDEVAKDRPALQILFFIIVAEAVAKLAVGFQGEGESKKHVRLFFEEICSNAHRTQLETAFEGLMPGSYLPVREAVDLLYKVRCDVVHEGLYFTFALRHADDDVPTMTTVGENNFSAHIAEKELRRIVLEGAVLGVRRLMP